MSKTLRLGLILILLTLLIGCAGASSSLPITISGSVPANYQVSFTLPYKTGMDAGFENIRFYAGNTYANGGASVPYYIESYTDSTSAVVWLKLPAGTTTVYCEWGIAGETSSESNPNNVFIMYNDGSSLAGFIQLSGTVVSTNGYIKIGSTANGLSVAKSTATYGEQVTAEFRANIQNGGWAQTFAGFNTYDGSSTGQSVAFWDSWEADKRFFAYNGAIQAGTANAVVINDFTGAYHTFRIDREGSGKSSAWVDGTKVVNQQTSSSTASLPLNFSAYDANVYTYIEWVRVRSFTAVTPTITVGTTVTNTPVAAFSGTPTSGTAPVTVQFTDSSTNSPTAWNWNFGDGQTSTSQSPSHQYNSAGTYTVTLTASNGAGSDSETKTSYITVSASIPAPVAGFSANVTSGTIPLTVRFTDSSTGSPTTWSWNFGDGVTSTQQNPTHTYNEAGYNTVTLTVTNAGGSDTETKTEYILVNEPSPAPTSAFSANKTTGKIPLTVQFTDGSINNPDSWLWNFGDGTTSTAQNPSHTYSTNGTFTVTLTTSNDYGDDTETKTNLITALPTTDFVVDIGAEPQWKYIRAGETVIVEINNEGTLTWVLDGVTLTETSPVLSYTFDKFGYYNLTAYNAGGQSTEFRIRVDRPLATTVVEKLNTTTYESFINATENDSIDGALTALTMPYTDLVGKMFYLIVFCIPFLFMYIQTRGTAILTALALIIGSTMIMWLPDQFKLFVAAVIGLSLAGCLYKISKGN